jgi:uncharacterized phage infection (PIP) family protein YhgE
MKKLYDEIMAAKVIDPNNHYDYGINAGLETASKLAKKYDDEIERLNDGISKLQSTSKMLLELNRTRYNEGISAGQQSIRKTLDEVAILKESYLDENEKLSTLLLNSEDEVARLNVRIAQLTQELIFKDGWTEK